MIDTGADMAEAVGKYFGTIAGRIQVDVPGLGDDSVSFSKGWLNIIF